MINWIKQGLLDENGYYPTWFKIIVMSIAGLAWSIISALILVFIK